MNARHTGTLAVLNFVVKLRRQTFVPHVRVTLRADPSGQPRLRPALTQLAIDLLPFHSRYPAVKLPDTCVV